MNTSKVGRLELECAWCGPESCDTCNGDGIVYPHCDVCGGWAQKCVECIYLCDGCEQHEGTCPECDTADPVQHDLACRAGGVER